MPAGCVNQAERSQLPLAASCAAARLLPTLWGQFRAEQQELGSVRFYPNTSSLSKATKYWVSRRAPAPRGAGATARPCGRCGVATGVALGTGLHGGDVVAAVPARRCPALHGPAAACTWAFLARCLHVLCVRAQKALCWVGTVGTGGCCLSEASSWGLRGAGVLQLGVGTDTQHIRDLEQVLPKGRVSVGNFISSLARWRSEMQEPEKTSYSVHQKVQIRSGPAQLLRDRRSVWWRGSHLIAVL